jgi:DNA adenine methylase
LPNLNRKPNHPALRYFGGKWRLAKWIISHFPSHVTYVEPFGGAASVLLLKSPAWISVYNDKSSLLVNFFRMLRERPDDLIKAISLTPYSRSEYKLSQELSEDPLENARRFYIWCWQGFGRGGAKESGGWRFEKSHSRGQTTIDDWLHEHDLYLVAGLFRAVQIEHDDAFRVIPRYDTPETLFFIDPPYVHDSRGKRWGMSAYLHEMSDDEHTRLADILHHVQGKVLLSGYACELRHTLCRLVDRSKISLP